jgi:hypothetical protein
MVRIIAALLVSAAVVVLVARLVKFLVELLTPRTLRLRYALLGVLVAVFAAFFVAVHNRPGDRERIEATIEAVSTSTDPAVCRADETQRFLEQSTGQRAPFADDYCESAAGRGRADSVEISDVSVDGDSASALVANSGGSFDGSSLRLALKAEGRQWRVDRLTGFASFDRAGFRRAYRRSFLEFGSPAAAAACAVERESRLSDAELERMLLAGRQMRFARITAECDRGGVERSLGGEAAYEGFRLPTSAVECIQGRIGSAGAGTLARLQLDLIAFGRIVIDCDSDAYVSYLRRELSEDDGFDPAVVRCALARIRRLPAAGAIRLVYDDERLDELTGSCGA